MPAALRWPSFGSWSRATDDLTDPSLCGSMSDMASHSRCPQAAQAVASIVGVSAEQIFFEIDAAANVLRVNWAIIDALRRA